MPSPESHDQNAITQLPWQAYEDVTTLAAKVGIPYRVLLDPRVRTLLDAEGDEARTGLPAELGTMGILVPLKFLLTRFASLTSFRFSVGPGPMLSEEKVPIHSTFHKHETLGYFVAATLDETEALGRPNPKTRPHAGQ